MKLFRLEFVDVFECIAGKCTCTCCSGWNVVVDCETYNNRKALFENIENGCFFDDEAGNHYIKMKDGGICPFLDEKGLCKIVIQHGESALPHTCKIFFAKVSGCKYLDEKIQSLVYRNHIIDLLQIQDMSLWARLYLAYYFSMQLV